MNKYVYKRYSYYNKQPYETIVEKVFTKTLYSIMCPIREMEPPTGKMFFFDLFDFKQK